MVNSLKVLALITLLGFISLIQAQQDSAFKVIVHNDNPISSISKAKLSNMFLKKETKWENGRKAIPVDQKDTAVVRVAFSKAIHNKAISAVKSYWQQKIFSGRDVPPPELDSDSAVISYVQANADAIGYVSGNVPTGKFKVLVITE
ncbi:MAG: hypothetical protein AB1489_12180 [Acidobacteriota bacterium]